MTEKKRVLVTGASGFIGRNIFERLSRRNDLEVIGTYKTKRFSNSRKLVQADLTQDGIAHDLLKGMDLVIHCAAITTGSKDVSERPYIHITDNVIMHQRLLRAAFDQGVPEYIFLSCTTMYRHGTEPCKEEDFNFDSIHPKYFGVAEMKLCTERFCDFYSRLGRTKFVVVRHSNIYGPHDKFDLDRSHMLGASITKVLNNTSGVLTAWGKGQELRDVLYIDDLVDFLENITTHSIKDPYDIVNIGYGKAFTVAQLIQKIIECTGKNIEINFDTTKPTIDVSIVIDIDKARIKYGWQPQTSLEAGLRKTIQWHKENIFS